MLALTEVVFELPLVVLAPTLTEPVHSGPAGASWANGTAVSER